MFLVKTNGNEVVSRHHSQSEADDAAAGLWWEATKSTVVGTRFWVDHELVGATVRIGNGASRFKVLEVVERGLLPHLVASVQNVHTKSIQVHVPISEIEVV